MGNSNHFPHRGDRKLDPASEAVSDDVPSVLPDDHDVEETKESGWRGSSFDLAQGLQVTEMRSKLSQAQLDKLFKS